MRNLRNLGLSDPRVRRFASSRSDLRIPPDSPDEMNNVELVAKLRYAMQMVLQQS